MADERSRKCEKCGSEMKKLGPYARRKREGEAASTDAEPVHYHCLNCGIQEEDRE